MQFKGLHINNFRYNEYQPLAKIDYGSTEELIKNIAPKLCEEQDFNFFQQDNYVVVIFSRQTKHKGENVKREGSNKSMPLDDDLERSKKKTYKHALIFIDLERRQSWFNGGGGEYAKSLLKKMFSTDKHKIAKDDINLIISEKEALEVLETEVEIDFIPYLLEHFENKSEDIADIIKVLKKRGEKNPISKKIFSKDQYKKKKDAILKFRKITEGEACIKFSDKEYIDEYGFTVKKVQNCFALHITLDPDLDFENLSTCLPAFIEHHKKYLKHY